MHDFISGQCPLVHLWLVDVAVGERVGQGRVVRSEIARSVGAGEHRSARHGHRGVESAVAVEQACLGGVVAHHRNMHPDIVIVFEEARRCGDFGGARAISIVPSKVSRISPAVSVDVADNGTRLAIAYNCLE